MEDLTNKQLKDLIRGYKKEKCPAFSKEKKEGLIKIIKTLGLDITLIPIKKKKKKENIKLKVKDKKPEPPKKPDKPDMDKPLKDDDVPKIKKIESIKEPKIFRGISLTPEKIENYKVKGNESWVASQSNQLILYEYILDKHKNDCIPIVKSIDGKEAILQLHLYQANKKPTGQNKDNIAFAWNREGKSYQNALPEDITKAVKKLRECKKRFIPLPFNFAYTYSDGKSTAHANMIILDLEKNTAEHLEPHGNEMRGREKLKGLDFMIENELPKIFKKWGFKYSNPNESCPYVRGLQSLEKIGKGTDINRNIELDIFDDFTKGQNGLCALWSYILLDLRLSNPDYTIQDILKIVLKKLDFEKFKTNVLQDFKKSYKSFEKDNVGGKWKDIEEYNEKLYNLWYEKDNINLNDLFFMYAITFAQEAFSNYINDLLKLMQKEADKNDMENFMKFIEDNNINPFKLMWIFHKVDNKKIELKTNDYVVENPNGLFTEAFYRNVEPKLKEIVFDNLLNKTTINVVKEEKDDDIKLTKEDLEKKGIFKALYIKNENKPLNPIVKKPLPDEKDAIQSFFRFYIGKNYLNRKDITNENIDYTIEKVYKQQRENLSAPYDTYAGRDARGLAKKYLKPFFKMIDHFFKNKKKDYSMINENLKIIDDYYDIGLEKFKKQFLKSKKKK